MYLDFINSISRIASHPLRRGLLSANVIWVVTNALVKISVFVNTSPDPAYLDAMVARFGYLRNCLESTEGFTWIAQSVGAGLLQALCDCSPRFAELDQEDYAMIEEVLSTILPRYLVFRSVIEAVDSAMLKIDRGPLKARIGKSIIAPVWRQFFDLARDRAFILCHIDRMKGHSTTCDNVKCQLVGPGDQFRRCSACLNTFYCSKECQAMAWKEGDHKTMCKLKQQERMEGRPAPVLKHDYHFLRYFSMFDARVHLRELRQLAARAFPHMPPHELIVSIDRTALPPTYALKDLRAYTLALHPERTQNAEARNDVLVEKVQQSRNCYTLVEMAVSAGQGTHMVLALAAGGFWTLHEDEEAEADAEGVLSRGKGPDREAAVGRTLRHLLKAIDENPALKELMAIDKRAKVKKARKELGS